MNSQYYQKYLKYKSKYLSLKNIKQNGGSDLSNIESITEANLKEYLMTPNFTGKSDGLFSESETNILSDYDSKLLKIKVKSLKTILHDVEMDVTGDSIINVSQVNLDEITEDKPVLVVFAGVSKKSSLGTARIIFSKLSELKNKYKSILIIEYSIFSNWQTNACVNIRDKIIPSDSQRFDGELVMNQTIANISDEILDKLGFVNIHLLGKCNGGWVVLEMLLKEKDSELSKYNALFLAVPGIPFGIQELRNINPDKLKTIRFLFGWTKQDGFNFVGWNKLSYQEVERYRNQLVELGLNSSEIVKEYDVEGEIDKSNNHEVHPNMIDDILLE